MPDSTQEPPEHEELRGEAPPGIFGFEDENGYVIQGGEGIIPILEEIDNDQYSFIGTGFFITDFGAFLTAKHVILPALERGHRVCTWQLIPPNQWHISPVVEWDHHEVADLSVGVRCQAYHQETHQLLLNARLPISVSRPLVGDYVATYAYPNTRVIAEGDRQILSFSPKFFPGRILESHPNGRDRVILPAACYRTSIVIHHGASGGPVAVPNPNGGVFAVNSTGIDGTDDSYVSDVGEALSLSISMEDDGIQRITIQELANQGLVILR